MLVHLWILIIAVPFLFIHEAAKPAAPAKAATAKAAAGKAAGKQKRITHPRTPRPVVNKSRIHISVRKNGSKTWANRTRPPFNLYQKSGKTAFILKPWDEGVNGDLENGTMTFYNRMGCGVTIYEFKHYIYKNDEFIYSEKYKNIVVQKARLTGDLTFRYHRSNPEYADYWSILYIYGGKNRTTSKERVLYNIEPGPEAVLFISFQKHNLTGLAFRQVGCNEATFSIHPV